MLNFIGRITQTFSIFFDGLLLQKIYITDVIKKNCELKFVIITSSMTQCHPNP